MTMVTSLKTLGVIILSLLVMGISMIVFFMYTLMSHEGESFLFDCGEDLLEEKYSPQKEYVAVLTVGSCGATTGFITRICVRRINENFVRDNYGRITSGQVYSTRGNPTVSFTWITQNSLRIEEEGREQCVDRRGQSFSCPP